MVEKTENDKISDLSRVYSVVGNRRWKSTEKESQQLSPTTSFLPFSRGSDKINSSFSIAN